MTQQAHPTTIETQSELSADERALFERLTAVDDEDVQHIAETVLQSTSTSTDSEDANS